MTEKQIEQLKKVLSDSKLADNSSELDDAILQLAHDSAQTTRANSQSKSTNVFALLPLSFLRSATLAIVLTVGVFFAMGQLVSVDENIAALDQPEIKVGNAADSESFSQASQGVIVLPENVALEPAPSGLSRDHILMTFELSETEELLAKLSFDFSNNSDSSQADFDVAAVQVAMVDINSLIQTGALDNARQRYSDLKTECDGCSLPDTLEALVIAAQAFASKSNDLETG